MSSPGSRFYRIDRGAHKAARKARLESKRPFAYAFAAGTHRAFLNDALPLL